MRTRKLAVLAVLVILVISPAARAAITLDAVVPQSPAVGETVLVRVSDGICDAIIEADGYPKITQTGSSIRVLLETVHAEDPILCIYGVGTLDIPVGSFPGGSYSLQVDRHYVDFFGANIVETVGTATFVVGGPGGSTSLPVLGPGGLILMVLSMLATAWLSLWRRHRAGIEVVLLVTASAPAPDVPSATKPALGNNKAS